MDDKNLKQNARSLINNLLHLDYSQTDKIEEAAQKLNDLCMLNETNNSCALIGLMMAAIMLGDVKKAHELDDLIWKKGGDLSDFFQLIYSDNLINIGEIEKLKMILNSKFENIGNNLKYFYNIYIRYALMTGDLALITRIKDYKNLEIREEELFAFAENTAFNFAAVDYRNIIKIILKNLKDELCAFDYGFYKGGLVEIVCYTPNQDIKNALLSKHLLLVYRELTHGIISVM